MTLCKKLRNLADVLVVEAVPLAVTEGLDAGIVVSTCGAPRMHHYREEFIGQRALQSMKVGCCGIFLFFLQYQHFLNILKELLNFFFSLNNIYIAFKQGYNM